MACMLLLERPSTTVKGLGQSSDPAFWSFKRKSLTPHLSGGVATFIM